MAERSATEAMEVSLDTLRGAFTVFCKVVRRGAY